MKPTAVVLASGPSLTQAQIDVALASGHKEGTNVLTHRRLLEALRYDPETGLFWWLERAKKRRLDKPAGSRHNKGYWQINVDAKPQLAHRLAWFYMTGKWPKDEVDHEDRDKTNNRWLNLRPATHKQNAENVAVRKHSKSGVKGVHFDATRGLWQAYLNHEGKRRHLGRHATLTAAIKARKAGETKFFTHA